MTAELYELKERASRLCTYQERQALLLDIAINSNTIGDEDVNELLEMLEQPVATEVN